MSNYTKQNLVPVPPSQTQAGTLAIKVGDTIFTAGNVTSGGGGSMDFYKCTKVYTPHAADSYATVANASSQLNGRYSATSQTYGGQPVYIKSGGQYGNYLLVYDESQWTLVYSDYDQTSWQQDYYRNYYQSQGQWYDADSDQPVDISVTWTTIDSDSRQYWVGRKAIFDGTIYSYQSNSTSGLTYTSLPVIGRCYTNGTLIQARLFEGTPVSGLIFYLPMSQLTSTAATGQSISWNTAPTATTYKNIPCWQFNNSGIQIPTLGYQFDTSFTASIWVCQPTPTTNQRAFYTEAAETGEGKEITMQIWDQYPLFGYGGNSSNVAVAQEAGISNKWYHFVLVCDRNQVKSSCYLNGWYIGSRGIINYSPQKNKLWLGRNSSESEKLVGYLAAVRIYNRALTANQIAQLYAEFTPSA